MTKLDQLHCLRCGSNHWSQEIYRDMLLCGVCGFRVAALAAHLLIDGDDIVPFMRSIRLLEVSQENLVLQKRVADLEKETDDCHTLVSDLTSKVNELRSRPTYSPKLIQRLEAFANIVRMPVDPDPTKDPRSDELIHTAVERLLEAFDNWKGDEDGVNWPDEPPPDPTEPPEPPGYAPNSTLVMHPETYEKFLEKYGGVSDVSKGLPEPTEGMVVHVDPTIPAVPGGVVILSGEQIVKIIGLPEGDDDDDALGPSQDPEPGTD